jgi:hypothetical protein
VRQKNADVLLSIRAFRNERVKAGSFYKRKKMRLSHHWLPCFVARREIFEVPTYRPDNGMGEVGAQESNQPFSSRCGKQCGRGTPRATGRSPQAKAFFGDLTCTVH